MTVETERDDDDPGRDKDEIAGLPKVERAYLIPAKDNKGVSVRLQCRAQPEVARLINDVIASKKYPLRVQGDLIRWCIVSGTRKLAAGAGIKSVMAQGWAISEMLIDELYQIDFADNFNKLKQVVDRYLERGSPAKAREIVTRVMIQIEAMPEAQRWHREQYKDELVRRYQSLLDATQAAPHKKSLFGTGENE